LQLFAGLLAAFAVTLSTSVRVLGQGTILFDTHVPGIVDAQVTTGSRTSPVSGEGLVAQLIGLRIPSLQQDPLFPTTGFFTSGGSLGYVIPVVVTVPNVPPGEEFTVFMRVTSELDRFTIGSTGPITIVLGGGNQPAAYLTGMRDAILVPEPKTFGLAMIGAGLLACLARALRRKIPSVKPLPACGYRLR
jgi:hypothetical protein